MGLEHLNSLLAKCFKYNRYAEAIAVARKCISEDPYYRDHWESMKELIANRAIGPESAYDFFNRAANLALDENTNEEVYAWLDLMVLNLEKQSAEIVEY